MKGSWAKLGHVLYGQGEFYMVPTEKNVKSSCKVSALNQYGDNDLLTNTQSTTAPPPSFTTTYSLPVSCLKPIQLQLPISSPPTKPTKAESLLMWCNCAWQPAEITFTTPICYRTCWHRHRSPSWGQDIVTCKKNKLLKKTNPPPHTWATFCDANLKSFPLTHFLEQNPFLEYKLFQFLLPPQFHFSGI